MKSLFLSTFSVSTFSVTITFFSNIMNRIKQVEKSLNHLPKDVVDLINDFNDVFEISDKKSHISNSLRKGYKRWLNRIPHETEYELKSRIWIQRNNGSLILSIPWDKKSKWRTSLDIATNPYCWSSFRFWMFVKKFE